MLCGMAEQTVTVTIESNRPHSELVEAVRHLVVNAAAGYIGDPDDFEDIDVRSVE